MYLCNCCYNYSAVYSTQFQSLLPLKNRIMRWSLIFGITCQKVVPRKIKKIVGGSNLQSGALYYWHCIDPSSSPFLKWRMKFPKTLARKGAGETKRGDTKISRGEWILFISIIFTCFYFFTISYLFLPL